MAIDYAVIGAGSAGCVIANRLSEDPQANCHRPEAPHDGNTPAASRILIPADLSIANEKPMAALDQFVGLIETKLIANK